jgi:DNA invertase Pin-like site-specific DNA recombinase
METNNSQQVLAQQSMAISPVAIHPPVRYCLYARKSTEQEEKQILSIDSQIKEMLEIAQRENLQVVEIRKESHSAKASGQRPVYNQLIADIKTGIFNGIITWAPDRLSRNAGDLGAVIDLMDQKLLLEIRTYSQRFADSPNEKFLLMILGSQAKLENDNRSINIKRGMRARVEMGYWPCVAPTGYSNENLKDKPGSVVLDPIRAPVIKQMFEKIALSGWSGRKVYIWLKHDLKFVTRHRKAISLGNIYLILRNTFYYGEVEYPQGSKNWYHGKHQPIITKELFDQVQAKLKQKSDTKQSYGKEFAFTKLIKCGLCGSNITADEKFKELKNGTTAKYVYYGCNRSKDHDCKSGYIKEEQLLEQLLKIIDQVDLDQLGIKEKLQHELERFNKFRYGVLGLSKEDQLQQTEIDCKNYARYILKEGAIAEKRELLGCMRSGLVFSEGKIILDVP